MLEQSSCLYRRKTQKCFLNITQFCEEYGSKFKPLHKSLTPFLPPSVAAQRSLGVREKHIGDFGIVETQAETRFHIEA